MKTQLPEKIKAPTISFSGSTRITNAPMSQTDTVLNQLIDVVAELTEELEKAYCPACLTTLISQAPTLKETLLMEINKLPQHVFMGEKGYDYVRKKDVKAIINRLMP